MKQILKLIQSDIGNGSERTTKCLIPVATEVVDFSDVPDGPYEERDKDGNSLLKGTIKKGHLNGKVECHLDGYHIICQMKDGVLHGPWNMEGNYDSYHKVYFHKYSGNFEAGELKGLYKATDGWTALTANVEKLIRKNDSRRGDNFRLVGEIQSNWVRYSLDENGRTHGDYERKERVYDGKTTHGKMVTCQKRVYDHGQIIQETNFDTETGKISSEKHFKKDKGNGIIIPQYGIPHGHFKKFYAGQCVEDLSFKDGVLDGKCINNPVNEKGEKESFPSSWEAYLPDSEQFECVFEQGKPIKYTKLDVNGNIVAEFPGKTGTNFVWRYFWAPKHGLQPELIGRCTNLKKLYLDNSTENRSGNWCVSNRKIPQEVWDGIAQNTDLEEVKLQFMDVDYKALSHLKKLKHLTISNKGMYGNSGFTVRDSDIENLGTLPKLETLSIDISRISAEGLARIKEQFPKLKKLTLTTRNPVVAEKKKIEIGEEGWFEESQKISCMEILQSCEGIEFDINHITKKELAREIEEVKRKRSLMGPGFEEKFKAALKKNDSKSAVEILVLNGVIPEIDKKYNSSYFSEPSSVYGDIVYRIDNDTLQYAMIKDLKNGNYAIATRRHKEHGSSGDGGEITDSYYGELMVLNLEDGVLASKHIDYTKTRGWGLGESLADGFDGEKSTYYGLNDIAVKDGQVSVCGTTLPIDPPKRKDLRARLRAASTTKERKSIAEMLADGTYKRDTQAKALISLRRARDKEKSSLTTRAYQAKKESTK